MAYIGQQPVVGRYILLDQISGGFNGTASGFTMSTAGGVQGVIPGLAQNVLLSLGGVIQQPGVDYTISGSGLTFTTPPVSGTTFFATVLGDAQSVGTPSDGTVTPASIAAGYDFAFPNLTVTGVTTIASGTAAAPSLTVTGDTDTGLYSPGANQLAISTNGTGRLFVDASGNVGVGITPSGPFDVYGGTWKRLLVTYPDTYTTKLALSTGGYLQSSVGDDAVRLYNTANGPTIFATNNTERLRITSDGKLGLGTSAPASKLDIQDTSGTTNAPVIIQNISALSSGTVANGFGPAIRFQGEDAGGANRDMAYVSSVYTNASTVDTALTFYTRDNLGALTEKVRIDEQGRVGIGTTSPSQRLNLNIGGDQTWLQIDKTRASDEAMIQLVHSTTNRGSKIRYANADSSWVVGIDGSESFVFTSGEAADGSGGTERARIDSSGRLLVGTSTAFSSTRNAYESEATPTRVEYVATATNSVNNGFGVYNFSSSGYAPNLDLCASKSNTVGGHSVVSSDQAFGHINFGGSDGTQFRTGATILGAADGTPGSGDMPGKLVFSTTPDGSASPVERVRIRSGGTVDMFVDAGALNSRSSFAASASEYLYIGRHSATNTNTGTLSFAVYTNGNVVNTNNSYGAISDIKLKENIVDAGSQWDDLKALQVRKYNFKEGQTHTQIGLIAQEVELVSPGLVSESPDRDEEGNDLGTVTKSVNYSVLYMKAVKALQEAITRIETLEAEVQALKGA